MLARTLVATLLIACGSTSPSTEPDAAIPLDTPPAPDAISIDAPDEPALVTLAMGENRPNTIAVLAGDVYWTTRSSSSAGEVRKVSPGGSVQVLATGQQEASAIDVGPGFLEPTVFWGQASLQGQIRQLATTGAPPLTSYALNDVIYSLVLDGDSVFVGTRSKIVRKGLANSETPVNIATGYGNGVTAITADSQGVVFGARLVSGAWIIATVARSGGAVTTRVSSTVDETIRDVAILGADVYWVRGRDLLRVPRSGGTATPEVIKTFATFDRPWALEAAAGKLFVATNQGVINPSGATGRILEIDPVTKAEVELATGQAEPFGIAVEGNHVYWPNHGVPGIAGSIMRARRD